MTDRISSFTVFLTKDVREDDAEAIANALRMVKGVMRVTPHVADPAADIVELRVRAEIERDLWAMLRREPPR